MLEQKDDEYGEKLRELAQQHEKEVMRINSSNAIEVRDLRVAHEEEKLGL